jgi:hypothetical protein
LDIIPHEGEIVEIEFLFPFFGCSHWEVNKVCHYVDHDLHEIHYELRPKLNCSVRMKEDEKDYELDEKYYDEEMKWFSRKKTLLLKEVDGRNYSASL